MDPEKTCIDAPNLDLETTDVVLTGSSEPSSSRASLDIRHVEVVETVVPRVPVVDKFNVIFILSIMYFLEYFILG